MKTENRQYFVDTAEFYPAEFYPNGMYSPPMALWYRRRGGDEQIALLDCGNRDYTKLFRDGDDVIVYSENDSLEYMAISIYRPGSGIIDNAFLSNQDFRELEYLKPINRAKAMLNYL